MAERIQAVGSSTTLADRKRRAGQRVWLGIHGFAVDADTRALIEELQPGGYVLFARNIAEPAQVLDLCRELKSLADEHHPAILAVDQEGGRVQRIGAPAVLWPSMLEVAQADLVAEVSKAMALELLALGFDLNLAPVADVHSNPANTVIGDRAFGDDPARVARCVHAFVKAHQATGLMACLKHFPGHGDTLADSHTSLPRVEEERPRLLSRELPPFWAGLEAGVATVMVGHLDVPAFDEDRCTSMSPIWLNLLRDRGHEGVVIADDLEMAAVTAQQPLEEAVRLMDLAGVDVLPVCHTPAVQLHVYETLVRLQEEGADTLAEDAYDRTIALREDYFLRKTRRPGLEQLGRERGLADRVRERVHG